MSATQKFRQAVGDYNILQPACPSCGRASRLSRITPGTSGLPDLRTYACGNAELGRGRGSNQSAGPRVTLSSVRQRSQRVHAFFSQGTQLAASVAAPTAPGEPKAHSPSPLGASGSARIGRMPMRAG
jgi:hypothetical protein